MLTVACITCRRNACLDWFLDSLARESKATPMDLHVIIVDFYALEPGRRQPHWAFPTLIWTPPKPTVWQGPHRLTPENWWAISNARNTAICLAPDGWIAFVDDRAVLLPGWLSCIQEAMNQTHAVFGSYQKAFDVVVKDGLLISFKENSMGFDGRKLHLTEPFAPVPCKGQWCFGCGGAFPIEWALSVNGYDEDCDGLSFEDVIFGCMLEKQGYLLFYDPRMVTFEDRTPSKLEPPFRRTDKGISPRDKSHAILNAVLYGGRHTAPNYFGEGGIRALREKTLRGEPFPIIQCPQHDWFDGQPLSQMQ